MERASQVAAAAALLSFFVIADARAFETRVRFVQRVGNTDIPVTTPVHYTEVPAGGTIRLRLQFGVFDDDNGPAPAGGVLGWNRAEMTVTGGSIYPMPVSRTPGRLAPFTFSGQPNANGFPTSDPFTHITEIDNTFGIQAPPWPAGSDPDNPPAPQILGLNSFVSVYQISLLVPDFSYKESRSIHISGNFRAASAWRLLGTPIPPTEDENGNITYAPLALPGVPVEHDITIFNVAVPAPTTAAMLAVLLLPRRRR